MKTRRNTFLEIQNWIILDKHTFHMYNTDETPFTALKVKIGTTIEEKIGINSQYSQKVFDIIRWISEKEYLQLAENSGIIIW